MRGVAIKSGDRVGRLVYQWPVSYTRKTNGSTKGRGVYWLCLCDCGNLHISTAGKSQSCGCYLSDCSRQRATTHGLSKTVEHKTYRRLKHRSKKENLPFDITAKDIVIPAICPMLGIALDKNVRNVHANNSPSVDKIIPELGYTKGNIIVMSFKANAMKRDSTLEEFELMASNWRGLCERGYL